jgi:hypothetical protein
MRRGELLACIIQGLKPIEVVTLLQPKQKIQEECNTKILKFGRMMRITIHEWRDWFLEYIFDNRYQLSSKIDLSVHSIIAKDSMDAENQCKQIINAARVRGADESSEDFLKP